LGSDPDALSRGRLLETPEDGRLKLYLVWKTLCLRKQRHILFQAGEYVPLAVAGAKANHVVAFTRKFEATSVLVIVPRLVASLLNDNDTSIDHPPIGPKVWEDTHVLLPSCDGSEKYRNAFTGEVLDVQKLDLQKNGANAKVDVSKALAEFPVALCLLS